MATLENILTRLWIVVVCYSCSAYDENDTLELLPWNYHLTPLWRKRWPICKILSHFSKLSSLVPKRSLLPRCPREVWERAGERTPSQYWQNTSDFSGILPLVTFYKFLLTAPFWKNCSPIVWICRLKCLETAVSSNFVTYYFSRLIFCLS